LPRLPRAEHWSEHPQPLFQYLARMTPSINFILFRSILSLRAWIWHPKSTATSRRLILQCCILSVQEF
jgi:hypothetical protein